jgi:hypothetical protein
MKISGVIKNETYEVVVKFSTLGTQDNYYKKIVVKKVLSTITPEYFVKKALISE